MVTIGTIFLISVTIFLIVQSVNPNGLLATAKVIGFILLALALFFIVLNYLDEYSLPNENSNSSNTINNTYTNKYSGYLREELVECIEEYEYSNEEMSNAISNALHTLEYADDDYYDMQWAIEAAINDLGNAVNEVNCSSLYN